MGKAQGIGRERDTLWSSKPTGTALRRDSQKATRVPDFSLSDGLSTSLLQGAQELKAQTDTSAGNPHPLEINHFKDIYVRCQKISLTFRVSSAIFQTEVTECRC